MRPGYKKNRSGKAMAFELKDYQKKALGTPDVVGALESFFTLARGAHDAAALQVAFNAARRAAMGESARDLPYRPLAKAQDEGHSVPQVCIHTQEYFRDIHDHLLRVSQSLDGLRDMVGTAMSVNLSMITLAENDVTKRLAAYAALVAVPTMIAGIYGMNFKNMPELDWPWGYPVSVAVMVVIDIWLYFQFKKTKWL